MTYDELYNAITTATRLHRKVGDPLLASAVSMLAPYLAADDPDQITLGRAATKAATFIHRMDEAYSMLYSNT